MVCTWGQGNDEHGCDFVASNPKRAQSRREPQFVTSQWFCFQTVPVTQSGDLEMVATPHTFIGKPSTKFVRFQFTH